MSKSHIKVGSLAAASLQPGQDHSHTYIGVYIINMHSQSSSFACSGDKLSNYVTVLHSSFLVATGNQAV